MLSKHGLAPVVLEREDVVAAKWQHAYESLQINTFAWLSRLPGSMLPLSSGRWPARDDIVEQCSALVRRQRLTIDFNTQVERIDRIEDGWRVKTASGDRDARAVVVASGNNHTAQIPSWPGRDDFSGQIMHSHEYRSARDLAGSHVLVAGSGNSAMDITLDLIAAKPSSVMLSVRTPPHIVKRSIAGVPFDLLGLVGRHLPECAINAIARAGRRVAIGDLTAYGLPAPDDGLATRVRERGMIPMIEHGGFIEALKDRLFTVAAGVAGFAKDRVLLMDGSSVTADVVIAATGYRSDLGSLVGHLGVLDSSGKPLAHGVDTHPAAENLHFVGFTQPPSGILREMRLDARRIARRLKEKLGDQKRGSK